MTEFTIVFSTMTGLYYVARLWLQHQQRMDTLKIQYHKEMRIRRDSHRAPKGFRRWYDKHIRMDNEAR